MTNENLKKSEALENLKDVILLGELTKIKDLKEGLKFTSNVSDEERKEILKKVLPYLPDNINLRSLITSLKVYEKKELERYKSLTPKEELGNLQLEVKWDKNVYTVRCLDCWVSSPLKGIIKCPFCGRRF